MVGQLSLLDALSRIEFCFEISGVLLLFIYLNKLYIFFVIVSYATGEHGGPGGGVYVIIILLF
jgi:hypothetical protein